MDLADADDGDNVSARRTVEPGVRLGMLIASAVLVRTGNGGALTGRGDLTRISVIGGCMLCTVGGEDWSVSSSEAEA